MLSVAFEGCACRAAFHVGVVSVFDREGVAPEQVAGASSGALVAAIWRFGRADELREIWLSRAGHTRVFEPHRLLRGRWPGRMSHVLRGHLDAYAHLRMPDIPGLNIAITRVGLRGPRPVVLTAADDVRVLDAVLGSCFIPGPYSRPVVVQRRLAVDGAWFDRVPIDAVPVGRRVAVVSDPAGRRLAGFPRTRRLDWPSDVRVLAPNAPLPLSGFDFDGPGTHAAVAIGEASAERFLRRNDRWLSGVGE